MSFAIGATPSLVKRVALKGALAHSAHVVLHVHVKEGGVKVRDRENEEHIEKKTGSTKAGLDLTEIVERTFKRTQLYFFRQFF